MSSQAPIVATASQPTGEPTSPPSSASGFRAIVLFAGALLVAPTARAATVGLVIHSAAHHTISPPTAEAITWHAVSQHQGHEPVVLDPDTELLHEMRSRGLTTLYEVRISWSPLVLDVGEREIAADYAPTVEIEEYTPSGSSLIPVSHWKTYGTLALQETSWSDGSVHVQSLPDVALQRTMTRAVAPILPPTWRRDVPTLKIPIVIAADDDYRALHGEAWKEDLGQRVERANAILRPAGLELAITAASEWVSSPEDAELAELLTVLSHTFDDHDKRLVVGFTGRHPTPSLREGATEEVGQAYVPGRHLILADQDTVEAHGSAWDIADEGTALAHEVLHSLGIPHETRPDVVMSEIKTSTTYELTPRTRALAFAAARARFHDVGAIDATLLLSDAAHRWIPDPDEQFEYLVGNLAEGPGLPRSEDVASPRLAALVETPTGRRMLDLTQDRAR